MSGEPGAVQFPGEPTGAEKYELAMFVHQVGTSEHPPSPVLAKEFPTAPV